MTHTYVVLDPKGVGNPTDKHLVVHADEYVAVSHKEKEAYSFSSEHDDYDSASNERNRLNRKPDPWTPLTTSTPSTVIPETETTSPKETPAPGEPEEATPTPHPSTATWTPSPAKSTAPST